MPLTRIQKIGAGTAAAAVSATALLGGTYAAFTGTAAAGPQSIASGTVELALSKADGSTAYATTAISNIAPGDQVQRYITVTNSGSLSIADMKLSGTTAGSTLLFTHADGVTVQLDRCEVAWTVGTGNCTLSGGGAGTITSALSVRKVDSLSAAATLATAAIPTAANEKAYYKATYVLPSIAEDQALEGLTASTALTFTSTQRAAQPLNSSAT